MKTFENYLRDAILGKTSERPAIDHSIRADIVDGQVVFYVHPSGIGGETLSFVVKGNELAPDPRVTYPG